MMRAVIAIVALLVLAAGFVIYLNQAPAASSAAQPLQPPQDAVIIAPETHVLQCGEPDYLEDTFVDLAGNKIVVLEKGESTEGETVKFLHSPKWINKCNLDDIKEKPGRLAGLAIYKFNVERDDTFYVFLRAKWTDTCGNSCWILLDGPAQGGHGAEAGQYYPIKDQNGYVSEKDYKVCWHPLKVQGQLHRFVLKKGAHTIELHTRQDGPRFDQLVITTEGTEPVGVAKKK